jgi:glycogen debranching enzyme
MKSRFLLLFLSCSTFALAQSPTVPAFKPEPNSLELHRLAQPGTYFDKVGRKFAILGYESGSFEAWAYPLKLFRNFELSFYIGSSTEPIRGKDIVRFVSVMPEATTLTYTYQSFTVKAIYVTPIDEAGAVIFLDVNSTEPLTIVASFLPVLQPMWPAGIGGQYAYWDDAVKAYLISEPTRRNNAYVGSPAAVGMSYTPAHMLSDYPNQFKIVIDHPDSLKGRFIPIVMAGAEGSRDSVKAVYERLANNPEFYYQKNVEYYKALLENTLHIETPNRKINLAFEWAKVAYDNLFVDNPNLGYGMVAGLGPSGTGGRPGFGWFFGGDAFINSFSLDSYGAYQSVKDALTFTQKWQRADGKMAHELSQAAGYVNWWKDYPYGYIHGDTSPFYICGMYDYYKATGDAEFVKKSWVSLKKAYAWSLATDENNDGLMDNKKAGLGALEYGPLIDIQSDIYTGAVWVRAVYAMRDLARAAGDDALAKEADQYYEKASRTFNEKFWDEKNQQYAYAFTAKGEQVDIVSPWSSVGLMWGLGDPQRSEKSLEKLNSAELTTDWGIRSISNKSKYFEPLNYNYGAVWPFLTSWVATAQFKHHLALQGYNLLMGSVRHTFDNGLGEITEVFSGAQNIWPQEAVAHQGFSSASVVLPLVRGMLGLDGDAVKRKITFAPAVPADWDSVGVGNYHITNQTVNIKYKRGESQVEAKVERKGPNDRDWTFRFEPSLGIGTKILAARVDGQPVPFGQEVSSQTIQPIVETKLGATTKIEIDFEPTVELLPPANDSKTGDGNKGMKIISTKLEGKTLGIVVEGLSGEHYRLGIVHAERLASVEGCSVSGSTLLIDFPAGKTGEFERKNIKLQIK